MEHLDNDHLWRDPVSNVRCFPFPRGVSLSWLCRPDGEWSPRQVYCTVQHCTLYTVHCTADTTLDSIHCILLHWDYTGQCEWLLRYAGAAVRGEQTWISLYWLSTSHFANIKLRIKVKRLPLSTKIHVWVWNILEISLKELDKNIISSSSSCLFYSKFCWCLQCHFAVNIFNSTGWHLLPPTCCVSNSPGHHSTHDAERLVNAAVAGVLRIEMRPCPCDEFSEEVLQLPTRATWWWPADAGGGMHSNVSWSRNYLLCHLRRPLSPSIDLSQLLD